MMKRIIATVLVTILAVGVICSNYSYADDEGWAAAGGFLGGLIVGSAVSSRPSYYYGRPVYYSPSYYPRVYTYPVYSTYGSRSYYYRPSYYGGYTTYYDEHCY